ncbi:hypothetical protein AM571_PA00281 (plasmid) [Rhizobium etli 8C-3]|uniref:Uncharacterized protein n=1 Tax=Rhizobium etli 8C-3 TaxID=538025 RepID=A0A1L5PAM3_RHIET|nr:hypothetical protein AM571_PA00281 [Rhizobium etli 8C-3]
MSVDRYEANTSRPRDPPVTIENSPTEVNSAEDAAETVSQLNSPTRSPTPSIRTENDDQDNPFHPRYTGPPLSASHAAYREWHAGQETRHHHYLDQWPDAMYTGFPAAGSLISEAPCTYCVAAGLGYCQFARRLTVRHPPPPSRADEQDPRAQQVNAQIAVYGNNTTIVYGADRPPNTTTRPNADRQRLPVTRDDDEDLCYPEEDAGGLFSCLFG